MPFLPKRRKRAIGHRSQLYSAKRTYSLRGRRFAPEPLEDRVLLAAVAATSEGDGVDGGDVSILQSEEAASIHGQKFHDLDGDGVHDTGEPGLDGWTIRLMDDAGGVVAATVTMSVDVDGDGQIDAETEQGLYWFSDLPAGTYTVAEASAFSGLVVFGDSLSDTGNVFLGTGGMQPPSPPYFAGRFADGPVWVEELAGQLGLAVPTPSLAGGANFAFGGAETGPGTSTLGSPNIGSQIDMFLAGGGGFTGTELVALWGGPDDFLSAGLVDPTGPVANIADHLTTLAAAGAESFVVPNLPPLGQTPLLRGTPQEGAADGLSVQFNLLLEGALNELEANLGITIFRIDVFGLVQSALADPAAFGLTNVTDPACAGCDSATPVIVPNPEEYLFWDTIHGTSAAHTIFGGIAADVVQSAWLQTFPEGSGTHTVTIAEGESVEGLDFGNARPVSIHGQKFEDLDGDGVHDPGEPGLDGWTIRILDESRRVIGSTVTVSLDLNGDGDIDPESERGLYSFSGFAPGTYVIREESRSGWGASTPVVSGYQVALESGESVGLVHPLSAVSSDSDVGWVGRLAEGTETIVVTGDLWIDTDLNGSIDAFPVITGTVTVHHDDAIDRNGDGFGDTIETEIVEMHLTGSWGGVTFEVRVVGANGEVSQRSHDLFADSFFDLFLEIFIDGSGVHNRTAFPVEARIDRWIPFGSEYREIEPPIPLFANDAPNTLKARLIQLNLTFQSGLDFGNYAQSSLHGQKFDDLDGDGVRDAGEAGLDGWTIQLVDTAGNVVAEEATRSVDVDGDGQIDPATEQGLYSFADLRPGFHTVREVIQPSWEQTLPRPAARFDVGEEAASVVAADLNGDGNVDLATANASSNTISVLLNSGGGGFSSSVDWAIGDGPWPLVSEDFDGDGDVDLAVANHRSHNISILLNEGDGSFGGRTDYSGVTFPDSIAATDFDGDGDVDLAVGHQGSLGVFLNHGDGTFAAVSNLVLLRSPRSLTVGDFDDDGDIDIATANFAAEDVSVVLNDGSGTFALVMHVGIGHWGEGITATDLDGDGDSDLAVVGTMFEGVSVLLNDGSATFNLVGRIETGFSTKSVTSVDLEGDGDSDLIMGTLSNVTGVINRGSGFFAPPVALRPEAGGSLAVGDFDRNGTVDLAAVNRADDVSVTLGLDAALARTVTITSGTEVRNLDFGNFALGEFVRVRISGTKFDDRNLDGQRDGSESGLEGWTIQLDLNNDGTVDRTTTTDANGNYVFNGVGPGTHTIREEQQAGFVQTLPGGDGAHVVNVVSGQDVMGLDFGNAVPVAEPPVIRALPAVVRGNEWHLRGSLTSGAADVVFTYGLVGDVPVFGDWDGNGVKTPGVFRDGWWFLRNSNTGGVGEIGFEYGVRGDRPVVGDWDGDGIDTPGVVRENLWFLRNSHTTGVGETAFIYGMPGDRPVVGDWDGDGLDTAGVVREAAGGVWWLLRNRNTTGIADVLFDYGLPGDFPVVGDWDGDGTATPGAVREMFELPDASAPPPRNPAGEPDPDSAVRHRVEREPEPRPLGVAWLLHNSHETAPAEHGFTFGLPGDYALVWGVPVEESDGAAVVDAALEELVGSLDEATE